MVVSFALLEVVDRMLLHYFYLSFPSPCNNAVRNLTHAAAVAVQSLTANFVQSALVGPRPFTSVNSPLTGTCTVNSGSSIDMNAV